MTRAMGSTAHFNPEVYQNQSQCKSSYNSGNFKQSTPKLYLVKFAALGQQKGKSQESAQAENSDNEI